MFAGAIFLVFFSAAAATAAAEKDPDTWKWNDPKDLGIPGLKHATIESRAMGRTVGYQIYLPPQYGAEPTRRFPVVYFLHGAGGTESSDAGLAWTVHAEIAGGRIDPVIDAFPNGGQQSGYRDSKSNSVRERCSNDAMPSGSTS